MKNYSTVCIFVVALLFPLCTVAQLNIKIGYILGYSNPEVVNDIVSRYNRDRPWLEKEMKDMNFTNGLQVGLRYRIYDIGLEATWYNRFKTFSAEGNDPITEGRLQKDVFFKYNSFSAGFEHYLGKFGYGASIDGSFARFRSQITNRKDRYTILKEFGWSSHFHLSLNIESGELLTISIKPYIQLPWSEINVFDLEKELHPDTTADPSGFQERFVNYGIMLVFYNGQW